MKTLEFHENGMRICFRINEDKTIELVDFSACARGENLPALAQDYCMVPKLHPLIALQLTGESSTDMHAAKHNTGSESTRLFYTGHTIEEKKWGKSLTIEMLSEHRLQIKYRLQFYKNTAMVRVWSTLKNTGNEPVGIDYVSSFYYGGVCKNGAQKYYDKTVAMVPRNSWANEAQWTRQDIRELGLSEMPVHGYNLPDRGSNRYSYGNCGSWSTGEYLPMGILQDKETGEVFYFEIDHSGSWNIEYGSDVGENLYVALLGPNDESFWWKNLKPGESMQTVPAAFGVCLGGENEAIANLTRYRRAIRRPNRDDEVCNVVFNDYMNCLMGDPTEEKEKQIIDLAAELGCEYYCMDCGWYDDGPWWEGVGEWRESKKRFPHGMKTVTDYAKQKGLRMGLWLEIESMGTKCRTAKELPDDWFFCLHGKRRTENRRYLLDFRNCDVRKYCMDVVDRLIADYGVSYFKIDYNVTTGPGSDIHADSPGVSLQEHYEALYDWIREIYRKYPDLVIEACSSGAQRMDYGLLSLHSLQSTSDQTDYVLNSYIASNVASALTPEQGGMWVYPYEDNREHVIYNMVNGLLLRPYISGLVWNMSQDNLNLMKEGISLYKNRIRKDLIHMVPFWPEGFNPRNGEVLSYGLRDEKKAYLAVFMPKSLRADINLHELGAVKEIRVIYPREEACSYEYEDGHLRVKMAQMTAARLFELML